jgi:methyl-accepting chemotaxis protein
VPWFKRERPPLAPPAPAAPAPRDSEAPARLARKVVGLAGAARREILARVREVNGVTEREVMGAARSVGSVADLATGSIESLRKIVGRFDGARERDGIARAFAEQSELVRLFIGELVEAARAQAEAAELAQRSAAQLGRAARAIDNLANEAKTLAINSRIEAGRAGAQNHAFSVVSDEMRRLSAAVAATNTTVRQLSDSVGGALAGVARAAQDMRGRVERFAGESERCAADLRGELETFRSETSHALGASDRCLADVVQASRAALSHLQFQDVVAQGLLRLDARLRDLQVQIAGTLGAPAAAADVTAPVHEEVGGDKSVANSAAGQVLLF